MLNLTLSLVLLCHIFVHLREKPRCITSFIYLHESVKRTL